jgi:nucleoside-diphosphate-sugar epimerase
MLGVVANALAAAQEHKIPLVYPANVWALGPQTEAPLDERADLLPDCDCNRVAIEIEQTLRGAAEHNGAQVILLRMPDLFGPSVTNPYVDSVFGRAAAGKHIKLLGKSEAPHQWGYAPDAARIAIWLLDRAAQLRRFTTVHFRGYTAEKNEVFLSRVAEIAGRADLPIKSIPWWQLRLNKAFAPDAKQYRDLRYLYERGVLLDDRVIQHAFEDYSNTDLDHAIGHTIAAYRERQ